MRKIHWLWFAFVACAPVLTAQSASNAFFDDSVVQQISLTVAPADWAALRQNVFQDTYYHAQFEWNGASMDVGIRQHGEATRSQVKPNLDVNIAHYEKNQSFLGINFFLLKANNGDASNLNELLDFNFCRLMGIPAPREAPAQLYVNGQLFGYFTIVEHEDTNFLTHDFGENGGYLYEWEYVSGQAYYWGVLGSDPSVYAPFLDLKTNQSSPDLTNFANMVNAINETSGSDTDYIAAISPYLNPAYYMQYIAMNNFVADWDGILSDVTGINNFYLYQFQNSTQYTFIPWDADEAFHSAQYPIMQDVSTDVLANRLMNIPEYKGIYLATLARCAQRFGGAGGWAAQEVNRELSVMSAAAENDPNKQCGSASGGLPVNCPAGAFQTALNQLQSFIAGRSSFVTAQVAATSYQAIANQPAITSLQSLDAADSLVAGTMAVLTGQNFGTAATVPNGSLMPVLGETYVTVNGERAPLSSVAQGQIVFQLPNDVPAGTAYIVVTVNGVLSNSYAASIASTPSVPAGSTLLDIDVPGPGAQPFLGLAQFSGWAADETSSITSLNVAVDGESLGEAQYGSVRNDVCSEYAVMGCPNVGWTFALDTDTLSSGSHVLKLTTTTASGQHAALSTSFTVANWTGAATDPMKISIARPGPNDGTFQGTVTFGGWALDLIAPIAQVSITVDGIAMGSTSYGGPRPDVCASYVNAPGCPNVAWGATVDTTFLSDGTHTLAVTATSSGGQSTTSIASFAVANGTASNPVHLGIGRPAAGDDAFSGAAAIGGWAVHDNAAISRVAVSVDGVSWGNAAYGGPRPDVCAVFPNRAGCPDVGWGFVLDTTMLADGAHQLSITAYGADGHYLTGEAPFTVSNGGNGSAVHLVLENPSVQSAALVGGTSIEGWAVEQNAAISGVSIYVDGAPAGAATYGISRPDVCATVTGTGCPDVGWSYLLDTTKIADGSHVIEVTATSTDGTRASASVPVTVANWTTANPMRIGIDSPSARNNRLSGSAVAGGWAIDDLASIAQVSLSVDGVFIEKAYYGGSRPDVCSTYPNRAGCPNVGWTVLLDTTTLADGNHTLGVTATTSAGQSSTATMAFSVANLTASTLHIGIDGPQPDVPISGVAAFGGWALDTAEAVTGVTVSIDGVVQGAAGNWARPDVCAAYANAPGCPNVGWSYYVDTTALGNGTHTLAVTAATASGARATEGSTFDVEN